MIQLDNYYDIERCLWEQIKGDHMNQSYFGFEKSKRKYVLKAYRSKNLDDIMKEHELMILMSEILNVDVPVPIKTIHGDSYLIANGDIYALFLYIEGVIVNNPEANHAVELGRILAEIHCKTHLNNDRFYPNKMTVELPDNTLYQMMKFGLNLNILDRARCISEDIKEELNKSLMIQTHGDFSFENVLFDERTEKIIYVLDWEESVMGNPWYDIISAYHFLYLEDTTLAEMFKSAYFEHLSDLNYSLYKELHYFNSKTRNILVSFLYRELVLMVSLNDMSEKEYIKAVYGWLINSLKGLADELV